MKSKKFQLTCIVKNIAAENEVKNVKRERERADNLGKTTDEVRREMSFQGF